MKYFLFAIVLTLSACATSQKINSISVGMTKAQVIQLMGSPASVSAKGGVEYLNYALYETHEAAMYGWSSPYFVRLIDGKVDSFGRRGDFDSTKTPEQTVNLNLNTKSESN